MEPGTLFYDPTADRVGEYRDQAGPYAMLRPVGGGKEWQADPAALRPATDRERMSARVRAANERARSAPPPNTGGAVALGPVDMHFGRPPQPVPDCADCAELARLREAARAVYDHSAETDANVLLRQHQRAEHQPPPPPRSASASASPKPPARRKRRA